MSIHPLCIVSCFLLYATAFAEPPDIRKFTVVEGTLSLEATSINFKTQDGKEYIYAFSKEKGLPTLSIPDLRMMKKVESSGAKNSNGELIRFSELVLQNDLGEKIDLKVGVPRKCYQVVIRFEGEGVDLTLWQLNEPAPQPK